MNTLKINHLAVVVCIVLVHAWGFLWYGVLFSQAWMSMVGMTEESMQADQSGGAIWALNFIAIAASTYFLAWLLTKLDVTAGVRGASIAFVASAAIHLLSTMNANMFAGEPFGLALITGGYTVTSMTISGFILGAWTKKA